MKNIHLLPTEKPSRLQLFKGINEFEFELCSKNSFFNKGVHIYITSDEEIKKGDYVHSTSQDYDIQKVFKGLEKAYNDVEHYSKIILTTDKDLIKDGVQEVDDEFLEWFVKNPKCEFIEVIDKLRYFNIDELRERHLNGLPYIYHEKIGYQIIITKEETKYILCGEANKFYRCVTCDAPCGSEGHYTEEPKQETLEEVAHMLYPIVLEDDEWDKNKQYRDEWIEGAKWQQEQNKNLYTEEDMRKMYDFGSIGHFTENESLEQFKKK